MKPLEWMGSSRKDLKEFPRDVRVGVGIALRIAQEGLKSPSAKPLRGFGGASVLEVVENHDGETYRAVYTVRFDEAIYVLHCFQKKSRQGIETPRTEMEMIERRLREAAERHRRWKSE